MAETTPEQRLDRIRRAVGLDRYNRRIGLGSCGGAVDDRAFLLDLLDRGAAPEWTPVAQPPELTDEGPVVLLFNFNGEVLAGYLSDDVRTWCDAGGNWGEWLQPTHWLPLPEPPRKIVGGSMGALVIYDPAKIPSGTASGPEGTP